MNRLRSWKQFLAMALLALCASSCAKSKLLTLGEILPEYRPYEGSPLDPFRDDPLEMIQLQMDQYDRFFGEFAKLTATVRFARKTLQTLNEKKARGEDTAYEEQALAVIVGTLPQWIEQNLPNLVIEGVKLSQRVKQDFTGLNMSKAPQVAKLLLQSVGELKTLSQEGPELVRQIRAYTGGGGAPAGGPAVAAASSTGPSAAPVAPTAALAAAAKPIPPPVGRLLALAFAPDGGLTASGGEDDRVRLWSASSGQAVRSVEAGPGPVAAVAFSPDGRLLASGASDGRVRLWDLKDMASGQAARELSGHTGQVSSLAFSADGRLLASGSWDGSVRVWDVTTGTGIFTLRHESPVFALAFAPDGKYLLSGGFNGTLVVWDVPSGLAARQVQAGSSSVYSLGFSPDGSRLAVASWRPDFAVQLFDTGTWTEVGQLKGHKGYVRGVAFSADGRLIASASYDRTVRLWDASNGRLLRVLKRHSGAVNAVAFSPDSGRLASAGDDAQVFLTALRSRPQEAGSGGGSNVLSRILASHPGGAASVVFSPDRSLVVTAGTQGPVRVWNAHTGEKLQELGSSQDTILGMRFSPEGDKIVVVLDGQAPKVWAIKGRAAEDGGR